MSVTVGVMGIDVPVGGICVWVGEGGVEVAGIGRVVGFGPQATSIIITVIITNFLKRLENMIPP